MGELRACRGPYLDGDSKMTDANELLICTETFHLHITGPFFLRIKVTHNTYDFDLRQLIPHTKMSNLLRY